MPHWVIYHSLDTFQDVESRQSLTEDITEIYHRGGAGMPAFYVVVNFIPTPDDYQFVGGKVARTRGKPFIRITVAHIHVHLAEAEHAGMTERVDKVLKPHIEDKGCDWEYHIHETPRGLWKINGLYVPEFKSQDEKVWIKANKVVPPHEMEETRKRLGPNL